MKGYLTVSEASEKSGLYRQTITRLVRQKRIAAERVGRTWLLSEGSFDHYVQTRRPPGRPPQGQGKERP